MKQLGVEVYAYEESGFSPLVFFNGWRVAILNHQPSQEKGKVPFLERHHQTDEVFVLLQGPAALLLAGYGEVPAGIEALPMEPGKLYNVPRNLWHAVLTQPQSKLLIVENADTGEANSSYYPLENSQT
ncbi:hypothetical protein ACS3UN_05840 [Oscillospiraceae bacterium LTW-04]|nr:cupin domain-containing protein [Oscillospiraceae bacterium MB24-C1]